jgi:peptidylprolyl isomerase
VIGLARTLVLAASLLPLAGAALDAAAQTDDVIASLGGVEMRASELRKLVAAQPSVLRDRILATPAALDRLVRVEMLRRALAREARSKGWDKRPEVIEQMDRAREQALVSSYMDNLARAPGDFPSDKDVQAAYDAGRAEFTRPRQYHVAQIYVTNADKANELAKRAREPGADFAALARGASEHAESANRGGDLGWVAESQVLPEVGRALQSMKPGEVSAPIRSASGWHVVKLLEAREPETQPLQEAREPIVAALRARRAQENEQRYCDEMLAKNPIAVNEVALMRLKDELAKRR